MKIKRQDLQEALELVKPGLATKELIEQSTSFAFVNGFVLTYNDEISISHPIPDIKLEGAIKSDMLYKLLPKLKQDEIDLEINKNEVLLSCGRTKAGLTLQEEITLPIKAISKKGKWMNLPTNFIHYMSLAVGSCGIDGSEAILTCIHCHKDGIIEGSDGMKIMRCEMKEPSPIDTFLIPAKNAIHVINLNPTKIATGDGWIHFKTDQETIISCRTFEESYPNTDKIVQLEGKELILPKTFSEVLERVSIFSKRDAILDEILIVQIAENRMKVKADSDSGWIKEEVDIKYSDKPIVFAIAPYLLKGILDETLVCEISDNRLKFSGDGWNYITRLFEM